MEQKIDYERESIRDSFNESINIIDGDKFTNSLVVVASVIKEKLVKTLGPYAHTTIIDDGVFKYPTKDGWNILKRIHSNDPFYQTLLNFIIQVSTSLVSSVGDGTTTAYITAANFIELMNEAGINTTLRQSEIIEALEYISKRVEEIILKETNNLTRYIDKDGDFKEIYKVALISSNGNEKVASTIQKIYQETNNPNIYVSLDKVKDLDYEIQTGFKVDMKLINREIYANTDSGDYFNNNSILVALFDHNVTFAGHGKIVNILGQIAAQQQKTILICAPNFDDTIMNIIGSQLNNLVKQGSLPYIMFAQVGLTRGVQQNYYKDFSIISNAELIDSTKVHFLNLLLNQTDETRDELNRYKDILLTDGEKDLSDSEIINSYIGSISDVTIGKSELYCHINIDDNLYKAHLERLEKEFAELERKQLAYAKNEDSYNQARLRLSRLRGKMGFIKVGGYSDIEKSCLKDSVDDAVLSCRSAYNSGYVRGMNVTIINALEILEMEIKRKSENEIPNKDIYINFISIFKRSFINTIYQIYANKFPNKPENELYNTVTYMLNNCNSNDDLTQGHLVYNIVTDRYEDFMDTDDVFVINPAQTDIEIIKAIVSLLSLILTSNQMVTVNKYLAFKETKEQYLNSKTNELSSLINNVVKHLDNETIEKLSLLFRK